MSYHVYPRYTPGSPALVDEATAMRVAEDEKKAYARLIDPQYAGIDPEDERRAARLGLAGIVEAHWEHKSGWNVFDVLTGDRFWRGDVRADKLVRGDKLVSNHRSSFTLVKGTNLLPQTILSITINRRPKSVFIHTSDSVFMATPSEELRIERVTP